MITPERGWNTWHPVSCSRLENLPAGLSIVPGAFSEAESSYTQFPFDTETRLLEHESSGRYCRMRVSHACAEFELEYLRLMRDDPLPNDNLRPPREWGIRYHMLVSIGFENGGAMYETADGLFGRRDNYSAAVSYAGEPPYDVILAGTADYAGLCMADKGYKSTVSVQNAESAWATCRICTRAVAAGLPGSVSCARRGYSPPCGRPRRSGVLPLGGAARRRAAGLSVQHRWRAPAHDRGRFGHHGLERHALPGAWPRLQRHRQKLE